MGSSPSSLKQHLDQIQMLMMSMHPQLRNQGRIPLLEHHPLPLACKIVIVNSILGSSLQYFIAMRANFFKAIKKYRSSMCNYLWNGQDHNIRSRVSWIDCCVKQMIGGLNIINSAEALNVLLSKWVKMFGLGCSNLKLLLQFKICKA